MATVIPPGYGKVALQLGLTGFPTPYFITYGVQLQGATLTPANLDDQFDGFCDNFLPAMSSDYTATRIEAVYNNGGVLFGVESDPANRPGTASALALPPNCAVVIAKLSGVIGRRNRGRFYVPGIPEAGVNSLGNLDGPTLTAFQNAANAFLTRLEAGAVPGTVAMAVLHNETTPNPTVPTLVTDLVARVKVGTQRMRLV